MKNVIINPISNQPEEKMLMKTLIKTI